MDLTPGLILKNYKEFASFFELNPATNATYRRKQEQYISQFVRFTKKGHKYIIQETIQPYAPSKKPKSTVMEISEQLIHEIILCLSGFYQKSKYGSVNMCVLTFTDGFELVGLAKKGWTRLRNGDEIDTAAQRYAYLTHYNLCMGRWRSAVRALEKADIIIRDDVYIIVETVFRQDGTEKNRYRWAETEEEPDCRNAAALAFNLIREKYPELKIETLPDLYFNFKDKEYHNARLNIFQEMVQNWAINLNRPAYKINDFFKASRFSFTEQSLARFKAPKYTQEEIEAKKKLVSDKLFRYYHEAGNEDKLSTVRPFLMSILDFVENTNENSHS